MHTEATFPEHASNFPRDRADPIAQGLSNIGVTLEDIIDFHYNNRIFNNESMSRNNRHAVSRRP